MAPARRWLVWSLRGIALLAVEALGVGSYVGFTLELLSSPEVVGL